MKSISLEWSHSEPFFDVNPSVKINESIVQVLVANSQFHQIIFQVFFSSNLCQVQYSTVHYTVTLYLIIADNDGPVETCLDTYFPKQWHSAVFFRKSPD